MHWNNKLRPFIVRSPDEPIGGDLPNIDELTDELEGRDEPETPETPEEPEAPAFDLRTREEEIRQDERRRVQAEMQSEAQRQQQQQTIQQQEVAELEAIAEMQITDPVEAERMRMDLAQKRVQRAMQAQYGTQLMASGVTLAINDADAKFAAEPEHVKPFIRQTISELGLQNQVPDELRESVLDIAYGKATRAGKTAAKPTAKTVATTSAERTTITMNPLPSSVPQSDAAEFEKWFGKQALNEAIKEYSE